MEAPPTGEDGGVAQARSASAGKIAGIAAAVLVVGTAGAWLWLHERPMVDEDELEAARAFATREHRATMEQRCPRGVLRGHAMPGDGTAAFAALLDANGEHAACWTFVRDHSDAVRRAMTATDLPAAEREAELPSWEGGTAPDVPPAPADWESHAAGRPLRQTALPAERDILAACAGVAEALERVVAHESVCSPFPLALPGASTELRTTVWLGRVLAATARERLRRGQLAEGFALLHDGLRAGHDLARGRAAALSAMLGGALIAVMLGQLEILLAMELPWDDALLRELERQVVILSATGPLPDNFVRDDAIAMMTESLLHLGWSPPRPLPPPGPPGPPGEADPEDVLGVSVVGSHAAATRLASLRCTPDEPRSLCLDRIRRAAESVDAQSLIEPDFRVTLLGPRSFRAETFDMMHAANLQATARYGQRLAVLDAAVRALWIVLEHRRLLLDGRPCPSAAELDRAIESIPTERGLGGALVILPSGLPYRPIEIGGPPWLRPIGETQSELRLPLARAYCPPFPIPDRVD
jgi:hypothetical protein